MNEPMRIASVTVTYKPRSHAAKRPPKPPRKDCPFCAFECPLRDCRPGGPATAEPAHL